MPFFLFHLNRPPPSVSFFARLGPDDRLGSRAPDHMGTPVTDPVGPYGNTSSQSQSLLVSCRRRLPSPSPIAGCVLRWIGGYAPPSPPPTPLLSPPREKAGEKQTQNGSSVRPLVSSEFYPMLNGRPSLQVCSNGSYFIHEVHRLRKRRYRYEDHPSLYSVRLCPCMLCSISTRNS